MANPAMCRSLPLRKPARAVGRSPDAEGRRRSGPRGPPPEELFPEILALPFVKYSGGLKTWAGSSDWLVEGTAPGRTSRRTIARALLRFADGQVLTRSREKTGRNRPSVLPRIFAALIRKGKFWGRSQGTSTMRLPWVSCPASAEIMGGPTAAAPYSVWRPAVSSHYAQLPRGRQGGIPRAAPNGTAKAVRGHRTFGRDRPWERGRGAGHENLPSSCAGNLHPHQLACPVASH